MPIEDSQPFLISGFGGLCVFNLQMKPTETADHLSRTSSKWPKWRMSGVSVSITPRQLGPIREMSYSRQTSRMRCSRGGHGRTATVVGCWLVRHGKTGKEALQCIRQLREQEAALASEPAPQTAKQIAMIRNWSEIDRRRRTSDVALNGWS